MFPGTKRKVIVDDSDDDSSDSDKDKKPVVTTPVYINLFTNFVNFIGTLLFISIFYSYRYF